MVTFIQPNKSFLPGLQAYQRFFTKHQVPHITISKEDIVPADTQIEWHFMGIDQRKSLPTNRYVIHEYCSLSTPPFAKIKDLYKKFNNLKPHCRIFSNTEIQKQLGFKDTIPSFIREVGIDLNSFSTPLVPIEKKYDFIYIGTVDSSRKIHLLLDFFAQPTMSKISILILSKEYNKLAKKYKHHSNIHFEGPIGFSDVPAKIHASKYAINYIPDVYPFNIQASTKLLEYAACQIPILTTNSAWIRQFEQEYGGNYYYFNDLQPYFDLDDLKKYPFAYPSINKLDWENIFMESGIFQNLKSQFPELFKNIPI